MAATNSHKNKRQKRNTASIIRQNRQAWMRVHALIEVMLEAMEEGLRNPQYLAEQWEPIFGAKSNAVSSLQKLVQVLSEIHLQTDQDAQKQYEPVPHDELLLITDWIRENKGAAGASEL